MSFFWVIVILGRLRNLRKYVMMVLSFPGEHAVYSSELDACRIGGVRSTELSTVLEVLWIMQPYILMGLRFFVFTILANYFEIALVSW